MTTPTRVIVPLAIAPVIAVVVWSSVTVAISRGPWSIATVMALCVLAVAADVDRREFRLPDALIVLAAIPVVAVVFVAPVAGSTGVATHVVAGAIVAATPVALLHVVSPVAMGFGDVKAAAVLGGAVGVIEWRLALVAVCVAAAAAAGSARRHRRRTVAFGPYLVGGAFATVAGAALTELGTLP